MSIDYALEGSLKLRDDFSKTLVSAKKKLNSFGTGFINNSEKINKSFNRIALGALGVGAGIGTALWKAYGGYRDLNNQLVRNQALSGASAEDSKKLEDQVKKLGKSTIFTAKQVAEAQEYQIMAGYNTNQILATTPELLKLSIASGEDLASTSDIITDSLSAFGLSTKDLGEYLDVLAKTSTSTNTNINMLGNAFQSVASSSRSMGEDYKEVALLLGVLADNGIKAEKAGTALRGVYARLSKPTDDMKKALKSTNTEIYDQNGKFKGLRTIIMESKKELQKLTPEQRNLWLTTIAGTRGMSAWTSIMNTSNERMGELEDKTYNATGALDEFNSKMSEADQVTFKKLVSAWDDVKISLGRALSPIILDGMKSLTGYLTELSDSGTISSDNIGKVFDVLTGKIKIALGLLASFKLALLGARAAAGDPTAMVQLAAIAAGAGAGAGHELAKREQKILTEKQEKYKKAGYSDEALGIKTEDTFKEPVTSQYGPKAPVLNLNMNNVTFNNGLDIEDFTSNFIDKLKTRE